MLMIDEDWGLHKSKTNRYHWHATWEQAAALLPHSTILCLCVPIPEDFMAFTSVWTVIFVFGFFCPTVRPEYPDFYLNFIKRWLIHVLLKMHRTHLVKAGVVWFFWRSCANHKRHASCHTGHTGPAWVKRVIFTFYMSFNFTFTRGCFFSKVYGIKGADRTGSWLLQPAEAP